MSAREAEVLDLVGAGLTNAEIGARLFISVRTVESHVSALLRKLDLADRKELAAHLRAENAGGADRLAGAPEAFTSFVGRGADLASVAAALASARLVTLTGPGGIGKTRLAIEVGRRHRAAAKWFVDLVPARAPQVVHAIAAALDVAERPNESLEDVVHESLRGCPALIVLDNCEHVLDEAAVTSRRILERCPDVVILATSREALGVPGELVLPTRPLAIDDDGGAMTLFVARARAAGATLNDADGALIAEICERLEGMPLAIELAAARCATLGVDGVSSALGDRFRLLTGARGGDERHRSLRAVLDWSYGLLDDEERVVLRRLAVFHGPFRLSDAAAVVRGDSTPAASADAVGRLAAKSLVVHARGENAASSYRLLETIREYGLAKLDEAGELDRAHELHLEWAVELAGALEYELESTDVADPGLDAAFDDLRAALAWAGDHDRRHDAHVLARRIAHLAYARRFVSEAQLRFQQAAGYAADDLEAARDLLDAGHAAFAILLGEIGYQCFIDAGERAERGGDRSTAARAFAMAAERGNRYPAEFRTVPERATLDELLRRAHELGAEGDGSVAAQLAITDAWLSATSESSATEPAAQAAVAAALEVGDALLESSALDALSAAAWASGRLGESARIASARVALLDRMAMHDPHAGSEQLDILHMASDVLLARGDLPRAVEFALGAVDNPLSAGALHVLRRELVVALCLTGRFDEAIDEAVAMKHAWERNGRPIAGWLAPAMYLVALVHGLRGARDEFEEWWELGEKVCLAPDNAVRAFTAMRLALHEDRLEDAVAELRTHQAAQASLDSAFPWGLSSLGYEGYLWSVAAEVWAARGEELAQERIDQIRAEFAEQLWAQAGLLRAEGRLLGDPQRIRDAAASFGAIEARFEEAATLALLDGDEAKAGRATLMALGCVPGSRAGR